jgi:hypothetical protein
LQRYFVLTLLCGLLFIGACQEPEKKITAPVNNIYFDVPGFIREQVTLLQARKPTAVKTVQEAGKQIETKTLQNPNWTKELEVFAELDINKPAFRNAYNITRQTSSTGSVTEIYQKKPDTDGDIQLLTVTKNADQQVEAIRAVRESSNVLLSNSTEMQLLCDTKTGTSFVRSFRISGRQKPIIFDTLRYVIITQIR